MGGEKFSKIDLTQAYMKLGLDEESAKYLIINTNKGLKQPTVLRYGVKPTSGILQGKIENDLNRIPRTGSTYR